MGNYSNELNFSVQDYNIRNLEDWTQKLGGEEDEIEEVETKLKELVENFDLDDDTLITMCMDAIEDYLGSSIKDMQYHYYLVEDNTYTIVIAELY